MTILTVGARRRGFELAPPQYAIPTTAPYNVPEYTHTPTYDGSNCTVHPDVIDFATAFGRPKWRGYRFWMAHTPYPDSDDSYENPSILASNDGVTWETPVGLTNPVYPAPPSGWNSDTDLTYDQANDQLVLIFRSSDFVPRFARSNDGAWWPPGASTVTWQAPPEQSASPSLVRQADGTWLMFSISWPSHDMYRWTAPSPEGPWVGPTTCTGMPVTAWHLDVCRVGDRLLAIVDDAMEGGGDLDGIYAASSEDDGLSWARNATKVIAPGSGLWDSADLYRATLQPHENGTHMRVWYSGRKGTGVDSWRVGLTHIPLTEWPTSQ